MKMPRIASVGAGAMGSVYAGLFAEAGYQRYVVDLWKEHITAIVGTRALINLIYGGRKVEALSIGTNQGLASPIKFSRSRDVGVACLPPMLGEHTRDVLGAAGLDDAEIYGLIAAGTGLQAYC